MKYFIIPVFLLSCFFIPVKIDAQLRLPAILSSGMVLQQNDSVAFWGWAGPGEKVFVSTGWNNHMDSTIASDGASWKLKVKTPAAGGPFTITIKSRNSIQLENVLVGEVWVCSGQSNMEMNYNWGIKTMAPEIPIAYNSNIRFFQIPKTTAAYPQDDVKAGWVVCDSNTVKTFSTVGYFFGKKLQQQLNVPIGLINTSWGGTPAETWTPPELIENNAQLKEAAAKLQYNRSWPVHPGLTYNAMIAPIIDFRIAGAIWYQGEANTGTNNTYHQLLTTMIDAWRGAWQKDIPFYYVQIAPYKYGTNNVGALLREAQTQTMSHPNVGMVVTTDLVDTITDIHPKKKKEVGLRLANWALAETYHQPGIFYKSPVYKSAETKAGKLVLSFDNAPNGLTIKDKEITGFYISAANEAWFSAEAKLEKDKIILWSKDVKDPAFIRYGFGNAIIGDVFSKEGLPLIPFRTDNWVVDQSAANK
jgi:sialate O-acetylesterase